MEGITDSWDEAVMEIWDQGTVTGNDVKVKTRELSAKLFDVYEQEAWKQWAIFNCEKGHVMSLSRL